MIQLVPEKYNTLDDYLISSWKKSSLRNKLTRNLYKKVKHDLSFLEVSLLEDDLNFIVDNDFLKLSNTDKLAREYDVKVFNNDLILDILSGLNIFELAEQYYIFEEMYDIFPSAFTKKQALYLEEFRTAFIKLERILRKIYIGKNLKEEFQKYKAAMEYKASIFRKYSYKVFN